MDAIRALQELVCVATAAQAALAGELDDSTRAARAEAGVPAARRGRGIAAQVAHARRESPHRGQRHLGLATVVPKELPHTWSAWRRGHITEWTVTLIARETACLPLEHRLAADEALAADPMALVALGTRELTGKLHDLAAELDPAALVARRRRAEADRHVSIRPAPDTMCYVTALLPVREGVAACAALSRAADTAQASGDPRTRGQVMADTFAGAVTGTARETNQTPSAPAVELCLVMTDTTLFGTSEESAHLDGWGPIPAELAREILTDALDAHEQTFLRRLYTHPATGELVSMDSRARLFPQSLARLIRLRDQLCRTPWCDAPIRHTDHATQHADGGATSAENGQGLCEACNHAKQAAGWQARPRPAPDDQHAVETTLPTGHSYVTRPPALATVSDQPAIRLEYYRAA